MRVAEHASFAEASRRLKLPTSSVSRAVARLEDALGVSLLRRTSRTVTLTDEGRSLLARASPSLEALRESLASTADDRSEPTGTVRVTAPVFTGATRVSRALAAFAVAHPGISVEIDASNVVRDLLEDGYDFAIRVGPHPHVDFVTRRLWTGEFGIFASRSFVKNTLGGKTTLDRARLERTPAVVMRAGARWRFVGPDGATFDVTPAARFVVNDPRAAVDAARQGVGIVRVAVEAAAGDRELVPLTCDFGHPPPVDLHIVYPTRRLLPRRVRMAIDWLLDGG